ncbi:hypothetical protein [Lysobacter capsici]|uniref:hypothetical protein n=1 Tax=Lysobacter capsici TaxID=435897 RepID=UPI00398CB905
MSPPRIVEFKTQTENLVGAAAQALIVAGVAVGAVELAQPAVGALVRGEPAADAGGFPVRPKRLALSIWNT